MYDNDGHKRNSTIDSGACIGGSTSSTFFFSPVPTLMSLPGIYTHCPHLLTVNGMVWYRPTEAEIDHLEHLGNPGWNWMHLEPVRSFLIVYLNFSNTFFFFFFFFYNHY